MEWIPQADAPGLGKLRRWGARNDSRHSSTQGDSPSLPVSLSPDRRP